MDSGALNSFRVVALTLLHFRRSPNGGSTQGAETSWQYDFASKRKWTVKGMVDLYFLVFIHIGTRRIWVSPCTADPMADWTSQQARNFAMHVDEHDLPLKMVMRDNDQKYPKAFDDVFSSSTCRIKRNVPESPNLQAHIERVIQTLKHEVLNGFCVISERHLDHILRRAADWYNRRLAIRPGETCRRSGAAMVRRWLI